MTKVISAQSVPSTPSLRTVVLATGDGKLIIKVSPITDADSRAWLHNELHIHARLSQMDAATGRNTTDQPPWNIVPLCAFAVRPFTFRRSAIAGAHLLDSIRLPPPECTPAAYTVQRRLCDGTLHEYARSPRHTADQKIVQFRDGLAQVCAVLHTLLAVKFTHGDLKLDNIGLATGAVTAHRVYRLAANRTLVLPARRSEHLALFDFGFSRAELFDARLVPDTPALAYRFGTTTPPPTQTFAPVVDLYRLTESIAYEVARHIAGGRATVASADAAADLRAMLLAVLDRLPVEFAKRDGVVAVRAFVSAFTVDTARALLAKTSPNEWPALYRALPAAEEDVVRLAMPYDVLARSGLLVTTTTPHHGHPDDIDMTLEPCYQPGVVYTNAANNAGAHGAMRVHPLSVAFPSVAWPTDVD